jgi:methylated-DNA-[protein]-cysteine S-methyltransferase
MFQTSLETPLGTLVIEGTREYVTSIRYVSALAPAPSGESRSCDVLNRARRQLREYFKGRRTVFDVSVDLSMGTGFQRRVWTQMRRVGFGEITTYADLARSIGRPGAQRAVGRAVANNPLMILLPCHRVLGAHGKLTGYAGGLSAKEWLLKHERAVLM